MLSCAFRLSQMLHSSNQEKHFLFYFYFIQGNVLFSLVSSQQSTVLSWPLKIVSFLALRWANGPDSVKLASPVLLKNISKTLQINISSCLSPSSPWSRDWRSLSKSTMMTKYGDGSSKSRDRMEIMSLLKAKGTQTLSQNRDDHLRSAMDSSSGQLWPSCLWNQFQLWPLERTPR